MKKANSVPGGVNAAIVWDLKLYGDVNDTHQGGNASLTLYDRIVEHGYQVPFRSFTSAVSNLAKLGFLNVLIQGNTRYAIRLGKVAVMPPNPFDNLKPKKAKKASKAKRRMVALEPTEPVGAVLNGHGEMSITYRLQMIEGLAASVRRDMEQYKSGVIAGL